MAKPVFSMDFLLRKDILPHWERLFAPLRGRDHLAFLEIGAFEGMSTLWFLENILIKDNCSITVVDTFELDPVTLGVGAKKKGLAERFLENTAPYRHKIVTIVGKSQDILRQMPRARAFDLIYIDGSHDQRDVLEDNVLAWPLLRPGGFLVNDDYQMEFIDEPGRLFKPQIAIDAFYKVFQEEAELVHTGWQFILKKK